MLRGVNVGGRKKMTMEGLRRLYEGLNFDQVATYVQSGNVIFDGPERDPSTLAKRIEDRIEMSYGYRVPVLIRRTDEFERILRGNPYLKNGNADSSKLYVTFLYDVPSKRKLEDLKPSGADGDAFSVRGREIYLHCPNGYGRTRLTNAFFEKKLNMPATTRNWNTVISLFRIATAG
jgi:uncharacterized protein (DUF1697 family)